MRRPRGFTLVELLVAVALVALLAITVLGAFTVGHRSMQGMAQGLDANQQLRSAIKLMTEDLSFAKSIGGIVPFCYEPDGNLYAAYGCEFTVRADQPRVIRDSPEWSSLPNWPGDLDTVLGVRVRYRLVDDELIREVFSEANPDRVYSSRVLLSGLAPYDGTDEGSQFDQVGIGLVQVRLRMPSAGGGSTDAAVVSTIFYMR